VSLLYGDQSILLTPVSKREEALAARKKFISSEGDLITYLNIFRAFKQAKNQVGHKLDKYSSIIESFSVLENFSVT